MGDAVSVILLCSKISHTKIRFISIRVISLIMGRNAQGVVGSVIVGGVMALLCLRILAEVHAWSIQATGSDSQWVPLLNNIAITGGEAIALAGGGTLLVVAFLLRLLGEVGA